MMQAKAFGLIGRWRAMLAPRRHSGVCAHGARYRIAWIHGTGVLVLL